MDIKHQTSCLPQNRYLIKCCHYHWKQSNTTESLHLESPETVCKSTCTRVPDFLRGEEVIVFYSFSRLLTTAKKLITTQPKNSDVPMTLLGRTHLWASVSPSEIWRDLAVGGLSQHWRWKEPENGTGLCTEAGAHDPAKEAPGRSGGSSSAPTQRGLGETLAPCPPQAGLRVGGSGPRAVLPIWELPMAAAC